MHKFLHSYYTEIVYGLFVLVIALTPFIVQSSDSVIISPFNGFQYIDFSNLLEVWHPFYFGSYSLIFTPQILYAFFLYKILPEFMANIVLYSSVKIIAGVSIYLLLGELTKGKMIRLLGCLFYLLSVYGQAIVMNSLSGGYLFYAIVPFIFYLFISSEKRQISRTIFFYLISICLVADTNFVYIAYLFFFLLAYALFTYWKTKSIHYLKIFLLFSVFFLLGTMFYYLPLFASVYMYKSPIIQTSLAAETPMWKSTFSAIREVLRLMGSLDFYDASYGFLSKPFFYFFSKNTLVILSTYIIIFFPLTGLLFLKPESKKISYKHLYIGLFLVFVFFSIGINDTNPFYELYNFLYTHVFFFSMFRDPYKSVLFISLIYTFGVVFFLTFLQKSKYEKVLVSMFIILLAIQAYSYIRGNVFKDSEMLPLPSYWREFAVWATQPPIFDKKKLVLPAEKFNNFTFTSQPGKHTSFLFQMMNYRNIQPQESGPNNDPAKLLQETLIVHKSTQVAGFYNIPYVINLKDIDYTLSDTTNPFKLEKELESVLSPKKHFGPARNITLYAIPSDHLYPIIYPASLVSTISAIPSARELVNVIESADKGNIALIHTSELKTVPRLTLPKGFSVEKKSNSEYIISYKKNDKPFLLVFNESFHKGWTLHLERNYLKTLPAKHLVVNGFTNGYIITPEMSTLQTGETIRLTLFFKPQLFAWIGVFITGITFLLSSTIMVFETNNSRKIKKYI